MCSFELNVSNTHILEFYRTLGDDTARKDRTSKGYNLHIPLPDRSIGLMVGMQKKYVHMVHPGGKRVSVIFR